MTQQPGGAAVAGAAKGDARLSLMGIVLRGGVAAGLLVLVKFVVHQNGWEFIETLPLLTALMGGVIFTLAILMAGVLSDFKESERIVGELASQFQRLFWDIAIIAKDDELRRFRGALAGAARTIVRDLTDGRSIRQRDVDVHLDEMDRSLGRVASVVGANSGVRTVQSSLGNVNRIVDRLETIIETTFIKAGYLFAGTVVLVAVGGLTVARLEPFGQGLFLYGFAMYLLVGLAWLIWDLDNPFHGSVRLTIRQLERVALQLERAAP